MFKCKSGEYRYWTWHCLRDMGKDGIQCTTMGAGSKIGDELMTGIPPPWPTNSLTHQPLAKMARPMMEVFTTVALPMQSVHPTNPGLINSSSDGIVPGGIYSER